MGWWVGGLVVGGFNKTLWYQTGSNNLKICARETSSNGDSENRLEPQERRDLRLKSF